MGGMPGMGMGPGSGMGPGPGMGPDMGGGDGPIGMVGMGDGPMGMGDGPDPWNSPGGSIPPPTPPTPQFPSASNNGNPWNDFAPPPPSNPQPQQPANNWNAPSSKDNPWDSPAPKTPQPPPRQPARPPPQPAQPAQPIQPQCPPCPRCSQAASQQGLQSHSADDSRKAIFHGDKAPLDCKHFCDTTGSCTCRGVGKGIVEAMDKLNSVEANVNIGSSNPSHYLWPLPLTCGLVGFFGTAFYMRWWGKRFDPELGEAEYSMRFTQCCH